ncbi:MAG: AraC family transcriptional regulator, partial [Sediminibacterium sp.]
MKKVTIVVPELSVMRTIDAPHELFTSVNNYFVSNGKPPFFSIELAGLTKTVKLNNGIFSVRIDRQLNDV